MENLKEIRILIAEDDYLVSEMIKGMLDRAPYQVVGEAANGVEAVVLAQSLKPDVILMDIEMPDVNGIEATHQIQVVCPTPVVILTAYDKPDLVRLASQVGAGAYLIKPPEASALERAISIAMARFDDLMQLRQLNAELQARNEELDAFAHTVAHDLQTSLTLITTVAATLSEHHSTMSDEDRYSYLQDLVRSGNRLSNVTDELLLLASIRQEDIVLSPLDMACIVANAQSRLIDLIEESEAEITGPKTWSLVQGYGPWVEEVWVNYISNAIKYGGKPPQITLGFSEQGSDSVRFWVRDNGDGLSLTAQAKLFKPFVQLDEIRTQGQGLGLSIVRRIVDKLGGEVGVASEGVPGRGSTFFFTLNKGS